MKRGQLSDYFEGVGVKRLSAVDAEPKTSNQHEVGTTVNMRADFLGETHQEKFPAIYIWLGGVLWFIAAPEGSTSEQHLLL